MAFSVSFAELLADLLTEYDLMPSLPKISIVVATLNGKDELSFLLNNIGSQSFRDIELIVIDGGSTDGTLQVAERNPAVVSRLISLPDSGLYEALNEGVSRASGEWLYFMGCDDYFADDGILQQVIPYLDAAKYDFVVGSVVKVPSGKLSPPRPSSQWLYHSLHHQGAFYHRRIFEKYRYHEALTLAADYELTLRIFLKGYRLKTIGLTIACFNETGMSGNNLALAWKECEDIRKRVYGGLLGSVLNVTVRVLLRIKQRLRKPSSTDRSALFNDKNERKYA